MGFPGFPRARIPRRPAPRPARRWAPALAAALAVLAAPAPGWIAAATHGGFHPAYPYVLGPFTFPRDEDRHDQLPYVATDLLGLTHEHSFVEWWHVSANLEAPDGRPFGLIASFLQYSRTSAVSTSLFLALSDVAAERFYHDDPYALQPRLDPPEGRLNVSTGPSRLFQVPGQPFTYDLRAVGTQVEAWLDLVAVEPPALPHGGSMAMGPDVPGNATRSWYYTLPNLQAEGMLWVDGAFVPVTGRASMERQWYLQCGCVNNDWAYFNLQLDQGPHLAFYVFYGTNQVTTRRFDAVLPHGEVLTADGFGFEGLGTWTGRVPWNQSLEDPENVLRAKVYTHGWRVQVPEHGFDLAIQPFFADQEAVLGPKRDHFYEGYSRVEGTWHGAPVTGRGFAEIWHDERSNLPPEGLPEDVPQAVGHQAAALGAKLEEHILGPLEQHAPGSLGRHVLGPLPAAAPGPPTGP